MVRVLRFERKGIGRMRLIPCGSNCICASRSRRPFVRLRLYKQKTCTSFEIQVLVRVLRFELKAS